MHLARLIRKEINALYAECHGSRNKDAINRCHLEYTWKEQNVWQSSFILILARMEEKSWECFQRKWQKHCQKQELLLSTIPCPPWTSHWRISTTNNNGWLYSSVKLLWEPWWCGSLPKRLQWLLVDLVVTVRWFDFPVKPWTCLKKNRWRVQVEQLRHKERC